MTGGIRSAILQKSSFSCAESGTEVMLHDCQNLFYGRAYSSVIGCNDALSDFVAKYMLTPFSRVSSDTKPVKIAGKGSEFSTNQHWNSIS